MYLYNEPPPECYYCDQKDDQILDIKYWFIALTDQLYGKEKFDDLQLEHCLVNLANCVGARLPELPLAISKKQDILEVWKSYNTQHLKSLVGA